MRAPKEPRRIPPIFLAVVGSVGSLLVEFSVLAQNPRPAADRVESAARAAAARGGPATGRSDAAARAALSREEFLNVEHIARLPPPQQKEQLPHLYRDISPPLMGPASEMILSSMPAHLLAGDRQYARDDDLTTNYAAELDAAATTMAPEQVADVIVANHGELILRLATRRRCIHTLVRHKADLARLVDQDLASDEPAAIGRACAAINALRLTEFLDKIVAIYIANGPFARDARSVLVWLHDSKAAKALIQDIQKDPATLKRHYSLLNGMLYRQPADPALQRLLASPDADTRFYAAYALAESGDEALAADAPRLAADADSRIRLVAARIGSALPDRAFAAVRPSMLTLLLDDGADVRLEAACGLANRKDPAAARTLLGFWKQPTMRGDFHRIMQAISKLTDQNFSYDIHHWGPDNSQNARAIADFEHWINTNVDARP